MEILKKIMTALRGGAREVGEAVVDAQGTRILEQEIRDAKESLDDAKNNLTDVMAKESQAQRKAQLIKSQIKETEGHVNEALDKGEERLALELAEKIAGMESELAEQNEITKSFGDHVDRLKSLMQDAERQIAEYERQLSMVKTTESVHKATEAISDSFATTSSNVRSAKETLERIKAKQEHAEDRLAAAQELEREASGADLDEKMAKAGVGQTGPDANDILERIKAKRK